MKRIKKIISLTLVACMSITSAQFTAFARTDDTLSDSDEKILYVPDYSEDLISEVFDQVETDNIFSGESGSFYESTLPDAKLSDLSDEVIIEDNMEFTANDADIFVTDEQLEELSIQEPEWNLDMVGAETTDLVSANDVSIAILDSGVDLISSVQIQNQINLVEGEQYVSEYMMDMTGHGTAVASIIQSILPEAKLYSVKILDKDNRTNLKRVIDGIRWCIDQDIDVINMSFGSLEKSEILENAIHEATEAGIVIVASAGNDGEQGVEYPAAYEETIAVGAVDNHADVTDFSSVGDEIDVVAPGTSIGVESMFGMHTWADGTSFAAPHVTAEIAALIANGEKQDVDFWRGLITDTGKILEDGENAIIDIDEALKQYEIYEQSTEEMNEVSVPKNIQEISTFEDEDISYEGKWETHEDLFDLASSGAGASSYMTLIELSIMKHGATYADEVYKSNGKKTFSIYWHGHYYTTSYNKYVNYIACYRYITKMAAYGGDTDSFTKGVYGLPEDIFSAMSSKVKKDKIKGNNNEWVSWESLIGNGYSNMTSSQKKKMRSIFLYGMAIHQATDTFAHSTFDSNLVKIEHPSADYISVCPKRYQDAKAAAQRTINLYISYLNGTSSGIGSIGTFSPALANRGATEGYYLANVWNYAIEANGGTNTSDFTSWFQYINYSLY